MRSLEECYRNVRRYAAGVMPQHQASKNSNPDCTPAANCADRKHDGQRFHGLDERGQEGCSHCRPDVNPTGHHDTPPQSGALNRTLGRCWHSRCTVRAASVGLSPASM
jgi:hypothetical protein